jgi:alkylation response protein AidB-like acyl-CoA dehydrogenase
VWTTLAHVSDYGIVIARTDPEQPKHAGISMFIVDLKAPGVEIRPIHQIDGGRHFNEVFFTDAAHPGRLADRRVQQRLAPGHRDAHVRAGRDRLDGAGFDQPADVRELLTPRRRTALDDPVVRDQLMKIYAMETTKSMVAMRTRAELKAGKAPGPGGSLGKLFGSVIAWRFREIALEIAGPGSIAWEPSEPEGATT